MNKPEPNNQGTAAECDSLRQYSHAETLINNLPYIAMTVLGSAIFVLGFKNSAWTWIAGATYLAYGAVGALWIMIFVCSYCHFWNTAACPCGYGQIAAKMREKKDGDRFKEKFRRHIPVIVPLWFIPPLAGAVAVVRSFSWPLLVLLAVFAVDAFVILPLLSRKHGCADCPQNDSCPWMGRKA
ncbi:MAG: hypothetical protein ACYS76_09965 [Planctomycetota bacterium]|jgi:hypothetical protein